MFSRSREGSVRNATIRSERARARSGGRAPATPRRKDRVRAPLQAKSPNRCWTTCSRTCRRSATR